MTPTGWKCPKCGRGNSPLSSVCGCGPDYEVITGSTSVPSKPVTTLSVRICEKCGRNIYGHLPHSCTGKRRKKDLNYTELEARLLKACRLLKEIADDNATVFDFVTDSSHRDHYQCIFCFATWPPKSFTDLLPAPYPHDDCAIGRAQALLKEWDEWLEDAES